MPAAREVLAAVAGALGIVGRLFNTPVEPRGGLHGLPELRAFGGLGVVGLALDDVGGPTRGDGHPVLALQEERLGEHVAADDGVQALRLSAVAMHAGAQLLERADAVLLLEGIPGE